MLVGKKEVGEADYEEKLSGRATVAGAVGAGVTNAGYQSVQTVLQQGAPNVVDVREFQYSYKCKHCGHEWSEVREKVNSLGELKGYTGD